ncbi:MAG: glycosyltransferase [Clostridia bacterium]|nr:glycosyltransferase [Clostridia bacterium]MBQ9737774.1 glycosyltransferase [Clostridia bacterium]
MLKVLQVSSDTNIGGAGKCILTYLKHFDRSAFEVAVVLPKNSLLRTEIDALGIKVFEVDGMADKSLDFGSVKDLVRIFKKFNPDIVHTHASMSARIAARLFGAKIVYTRHSVFPPNPRLTHGLGKAVCGFVNNTTADKIIAVAEAAKENICAIGVSPKKINVILNGVEPLREYTPEEKVKVKESLGVPPDFKCAAIVARLNEVKGHRYFVQAAKILKDQGIKAKFLIAGTGDMESAIKNQIKELGLEDDVVMLGFLTDVEPLMNVIDVQLNCSFGTEATSLSLLEGMSLGKPAVVSDFGGNPGVIKDRKNGFVVPTHNPEALALRLKELFSDAELYSNMCAASKEIFGKTFTAKKYAENIDNIYLNLGGKNHG